MPDYEGPQAHRNPAILAGLIRAILVTASTRQVTNEDRLLTIEELQKNAQESLDFIAEECGLILESCDIKELRSMSDAWEAWRNERSMNGAYEDR